MSVVPDDLEHGVLLAPEEAPVEVAPSKEPATPGEWVRANLFSGRLNGTVTVVVGTLLGYFGFRLFHWIFVSANWGVVRANLRVFMVGRFPAEELWRVWAAVMYVTLLAGLSWGVSGRRLEWTARRTALRVLLALAGVGLGLYLVDGVGIWARSAALVVLYAGGVGVGRVAQHRIRRLVFGGWLLAFPLIVVILRLFGGVPPARWGGFLLNVLVAVVGIVLSFPIGILLAMGRRSALPAVRTTCVGVIEFVRGAPLYTWLIFGVFVLPLLLPEGLQVPKIIRIMIAFTLFSSAYVAEIVRGGLQGVPFGQYEAARAVGLRYPRMMALVVLPQALRNTIPAMISHFISLFKDSSLLAVVGFTEALAVARIAPQAGFSGQLKEAFLFVALLFWVGAFSMSRWSQRLERQLGVGER